MQADIAPLAAGHLLLSPYKHYTCAAELELNTLLELRELIEISCLRLKNLGFKQICIFEHGRAGHCLPGIINDISCNHCHIHIVPLPNAATNLLDNQYKIFIVQKYIDIIILYKHYGDYFYLEDD